MLTWQPVISELAHEFPELAGSPAWTSLSDRDAQWSEFVRLVRDLYDRRNYTRLQAAFDRLEKSLEASNPTIEAWIAGFLQALQERASWGWETSNAYVPFLGRATLRIWATLEAIRSDLTNCSLLEGEILMWRAVHRWVAVQPQPATKLALC